MGVKAPSDRGFTTRWWLVDGSGPLFTRVSRTYGRKSNDTTTKSIIELWPRVSWCQVQVKVGYGQSMTSTEVQQQNTTLIQIVGAVPPNHTLQGLTVIAQVSIEVPQQNEGVSCRSTLQCIPQ